MSSIAAGGFYLELRFPSRLDMPRSIFNRSFISIRSQTTDNRFCLVAQIAMMSKCFALVDVADVNFDKGNVHAHQSISQADARMRQCSRVDYNGINIAARFVNAIDQDPFVVGLGMRKGDRKACALRRRSFNDLRECSAAIYRGLASP